MSGNRRERRGSGRSPAGRPPTRRTALPRASAGRPAPTAANRYGTVVHREALAPGLLGAIVLLGGIALLGGGGFVIVLYAVSILALILVVFALQAKHWWWLPVLAAIAVLWNPVLPLPFSGRWWLVAQLVAGAAMAFAGVFIRRTEHDVLRG